MHVTSTCQYTEDMHGVDIASVQYANYIHTKWQVLDILSLTLWGKKKIKILYDFDGTFKLQELQLVNIEL